MFNSLCRKNEPIKNCLVSNMPLFAVTFKFMRHQNVSVITMTCTWTESNKNNKQKG